MLHFKTLFISNIMAACVIEMIIILMIFSDCCLMIFSLCYIVE